MKIFWAILTVLSVIWSFDCSGSNALKVSDGWARGGKAEGDSTGIYLKITNNSKEADTLTSVTTTVSDTAELITTALVDGITQPNPVESLAIAAGKELTLAPDKTYIRLSNLKQPLFESSTITLKLNFTKAGTIEQSIHVQGPNATKFTAD